MAKSLIFELEYHSTLNHPCTLYITSKWMYVSHATRYLATENGYAIIYRFIRIEAASQLVAALE